MATALSGFGPTARAAARSSISPRITVPQTHVNAGTESLARYDVITADVVDDDAVAFAADSRVIAHVERVGRLRGRKAERYLRALVHPDSQPLLGFPAPAVAFWTLRTDRPSLALVAPYDGPVIERDWSSRPDCRFCWRRLDHDLPLHEMTWWRGPMAHPTADRLAGTTLSRALGWKPHCLLGCATVLRRAAPQGGRRPHLVS